MYLLKPIKNSNTVIFPILFTRYLDAICKARV